MFTSDSRREKRVGACEYVCLDLHFRLRLGRERSGTRSILHRCFIDHSRVSDDTETTACTKKVYKQLRVINKRSSLVAGQGILKSGDGHQLGPKN